MKLPDNIAVVGFVHGPFAIVVTPQGEKDDDYPIIVCPPGGYKDKEEAVLYIEKNFANRKEPYLGLNFTSIRDENQFGVFCSWED